VSDATKERQTWHVVCVVAFQFRINLAAALRRVRYDYHFTFDEATNVAGAEEAWPHVGYRGWPQPFCRRGFNLRKR
jgi:hypothetical protein